MGEPAETYRDRLPTRLFATDDLKRGVRKYHVLEGVLKAIVQHNWRHSVSWLVYDIDRETASHDWIDRPIPAPNIVAINRDNGHGHYFYGLETPVHDYTGASQKALRYMGSVDVALTELLDSDRGYSKLLSKNPLHDRWVTLFPRADLYDLDELAGWVDIEKYSDRRRRLPTVGLGRNCTLFERLRLWAYRERRQPYLSEEMFHAAVRNQALIINTEFAPPLPHSEVRATAKSVARWTWRRMNAEGFTTWAQKRRERSIETRQAKARELRASIVETVRQCPALTQEDIAALHGVNQGTVSRHLRASRNALSDITDAYSGSRGHS